jgi:hypothetical protein
MKIRPLALGLCAALLPLSAFAHQEGHGNDDKPLAATCSQLDNPQRYVVDTSYPEIKALKAKCHAAKKAAPKPAAKSAGKA